MLTFGSLFAGIGGMDLGLERSGMKCVWQVEKNDFCRRVLRKHWPHVPQWDDVCTFTGDGFERPDLICGGFPCQDISNAGKMGGIVEGNRSGLWYEMRRIICVVRPRFVLVENVAAILVRGMGRVLGDLAELGYDSEWGVLSAANLGAPHLRRRLFIFAYASGSRRPELVCHRLFRKTEFGMAAYRGWPTDPFGSRDSVVTWLERQGVDEPPIHRSGDGVPNRVDRLTGLGNAVVPQVAELIGRRIVEWSNAATARFPDTQPTFPRKTPFAAQSSDIR